MKMMMNGIFQLQDMNKEGVNSDVPTDSELETAENTTNKTTEANNDIEEALSNQDKRRKRSISKPRSCKAMREMAEKMRGFVEISLTSKVFTGKALTDQLQRAEQVIAALADNTVTGVMCAEEGEESALLEASSVIEAKIRQVKEDLRQMRRFIAGDIDEASVAVINGRASFLANAARSLGLNRPPPPWYEPGMTLAEVQKAENDSASRTVTDNIGCVGEDGHGQYTF